MPAVRGNRAHALRKQANTTLWVPGATVQLVPGNAERSRPTLRHTQRTLTQSMRPSSMSFTGAIVEREPLHQAQLRFGPGPAHSMFPDTGMMCQIPLCSAKFHLMPLACLPNSELENSEASEIQQDFTTVR